MGYKEKINKASRYYRAGDLQKAETILKTVLKDQPGNIHVLSTLGIINSRLGRFESAIGHFKRALQIEPENADLYINIGESLHSSGNAEESIQYFQKALKIDPDLVWGHFNLGLVLEDIGRLDEAMLQYQMALERDRNLYEAHYNLGLIFSNKGQSEKAIEHYESALLINPELADAHYNLGNIRRVMGQYEEAIVNYQRALEINPHFADAMNNLGIAFQDKGQTDEAIRSFQRAIQLKPGFLNAYNNLGNAYKDKGDFDKAIDCYQRAANLNPDLADTFLGMGSAYREKGQFDEAIGNYRKAIKLEPNRAEAYYNLGNALHDKGQFDEAIECFQSSLRLNPTYAEAYTNIGLAFQMKGQTDDALNTYNKSILLEPTSPQPHWNKSSVFLLAGNFKGGWRKYEWRFLTDAFPDRESLFPWPHWDGRPLEEKRIIVYAEQGVGDEIMFASCLPELIPQAAQCIVECDKRLVPLFERSFPDASIIERLNPGDPYPVPLQHPEMRIAMGSLPRFLRPDIYSFPAQRSYLVADPGRVAVWKKRFSDLGKGLKIGISWRGGSKPAVKLTRSTVLTQWEKLFSVSGAHFINLQYGDCVSELKEAKDTMGVTIYDWEDADPLKDLDNFAAQISALDLVISVDNAAVHMGGALGVPVWVLIPLACDWRWMHDFEDTPWYKSVYLIRQKGVGYWDEVFERAASDLRNYLSTGIMPKITCSYKSSLSAHKAVQEPVAPFLSYSSNRTCGCGVITPVGPGHETLYEECLASINRSFANRKGNFSEIIPIRIDDPDGKLGRSKARNLGIQEAARYGVEWIFFLDADDLMTLSAFEYVSPYLESYDGIWGSIWSIEKGETAAKERPKQLPFLYSIEDVLSCDPFVTLQMGHFVRTSVALSTLFDESLDTGEDFDYYLRVWEKYRCIKTSLPFFYNRRGLHAYGPRSATGLEWREKVEEMLRQKRSQLFI